MAETSYSAAKSSTPRFDYLFLKRFSKLFLKFISKNNWITLFLFVFLLFLALLEQLVIYNIGMITSAFYKILGDKDLNAFWWQCLKSSALVVAIAIVKSSKDYTSSSLYISWRVILTQNLHRIYFQHDFHYKVNVSDKNSKHVDNPDQRITQDVDTMCNALSATLPKTLLAPFVISYYSYQSFNTTGYIGPLGCFLFFIITTLISKAILSPIVNYVYEREKAEGYFRIHHVHVRTNSEAIAFMSGSRLEEKIANKKLFNLKAVLDSLIIRQFFLNIATNGTDYFGSIVSFLVLAVPILAGHYNDLQPTSLSQLISQNAFVSMYLISNFTQLVDLSQQLSEVAGTTHRIYQLIEHLEGYQSEREFHRQNSHEKIGETRYNSSETLFYELHNVEIPQPTNSDGIPKSLVVDLSLTISQGNNILKTVPSGCGKTSILRLLRGLWTESAGSVRRHLPNQSASNKFVLFLPQRPVLTAGSLRQQLIYPDLVLPFRSSVMRKYDADNDDQATIEIKQYMHFLGIDQLLDRVDGDLDRDVPWNWYDALSPGEMQRVAIVRLLFHKPLLAFLDEATSAVSFDMDEAIYSELAQLNITVVTCGHRDSLRKFHKYSVNPDASGVWRVEPVSYTL